MLYDALFIDQERSAQRDAIIMFNTIAFYDAMVDVRYQWIVYLTNSAFFGGCITPCEVRKLRVNRNTDDDGITLGKFFKRLSCAMISDGQTKVKSRG